MCMIQSVSIMSCFVDPKAHGSTSVRTIMVQTARNCGLTRGEVRDGVRFPQTFPQFLWRSCDVVTVMWP